MGSFAALYEELCRKFPDNKPRGDAFEEICQHYLRTHPAYQKQLKTVWLWDEWPDRWGPDTGIDLVAETHDGDRWAVQAKAWDCKRKVGAEDGIRTRDLLLGKEVGLSDVLASSRT